MSKLVDSITAGIIWSRLVSVADEMVSALVRTSFSTMVRESGDYSCMLFDARGKLVAQGSASVPSFTGTGPLTLSALLEQFPANTLCDGDVLVTNDPWMGTGHVYDINVAKPIFANGKLVAFSLSVSHLADIGGIGYGTGARDVFEEGLCIPPTKLFSRGEENADLLRLIRANVRYEPLVLGDIFSNVAACNVAARSMCEILQEYQLADFEEVADCIFDLTRAAIRSALAAIPAGMHKDQLLVEGSGGEGDIELKVSVEISEAGFAFDFEGTTGTRPIGINVPLCYTRAFCIFSFKTIVAPNIPNNEAVLEFVSIRAPEGCILNAQRPAATGGRHVLGHYVAPLIFGALAQVVPSHVQADSGMVCQISFRGTDLRGIKFFTVLYTTGGYGAFADLDGRAALPGPSNMIGMAVEVWEQTTGIAILKKRLRPDSGGPGKHQGGAGQIVQLRNDTGHPLQATFFGSRTRRAARGFAGGGAAGLRVLKVNEEPVVATSRIDIEPGATISLYEAGGGGFGDPRERSLDAIRHDLGIGIVTSEYVRAHYPGQYSLLQATR